LSIGYACLTVGVENTGQKTCRQANATEDKLKELIGHNLNALENIIDYNIENDIILFRISSDVIPFGSSPVNTIKWQEIFEKKFMDIGEKILTSGMRVSMHPGQYTVLNSPNDLVVQRAIEDLNYHTLFLDSLGLSSRHKIILHIGGVYQDKNQAVQRFIQQYNQLTPGIKDRLVLENDDKSYNIKEVLDIGKNVKAPVVFDNLHNLIKTSEEEKSEFEWIEECKLTWKEKDGVQKIHYSQQDPLKKPGSHSSGIRVEEFMSFYEKLDRSDIDIMLEVKDKNISAVACMNAIKNRGKK